jgi:ElaA protein
VSLELRLAAPADLDAGTLYRILQLRVDVFVVEQQCPYRELDGRDLEPGARWLWVTDGAAVLATLRILRDDSGTARIGRVATAPAARSGGIATVLMRRALHVLDTDAMDALDTDGLDPDGLDTNAVETKGAPSAGIDVVLDAQRPLVRWYQRFGFEPDGAEFVEDGISHLPMRRPGRITRWP